MKKALTILTLILFVFVGYTFFFTGFFRKIDISSSNKIIAQIALKGAEDIVVDQEGGFAIISATNRLVYPPTKPESGNLYFIDLNDEKADENVDQELLPPARKKPKKAVQI